MDSIAEIVRDVVWWMDGGNQRWELTMVMIFLSIRFIYWSEIQFFLFDLVGHVVIVTVTVNTIGSA